MSWECACGITNSDNVTNCGGCGWTRERLKEYIENTARGVPTTIQDGSSKAVPFGILGFLLGCAIGFLFRPSIFLIGQLPFLVVLTRGTGLKGADAMFIPAAQTSFNYMFVAGILGAILGGFIGNSVGKKSVEASGVGSDAQNSQTGSEALGKKFCGYCGAELSLDSLFCPKCGEKTSPITKG
jgi:ribosomal protein L40E